MLVPLGSSPCTLFLQFLSTCDTLFSTMSFHALIGERKLYLFSISIVSVFRRVWFNLGKEIVVLLCAMVVGATFFYIFHDFLNHAVAGISRNMRDVFALGSAYVAAAVCGFALGKFFCREYTSDYIIVQRRLGASPRAIRIFMASRFIWGVILHLSSLYLICHYLLQLTSYTGIMVVLPPAFLLGTALRIGRFPGTRHTKAKPPGMFAWRLRQIRAGERIKIGIVLLLACSCYPLSYLQAPFFVFACVALACGLVLAFTISTQVVRDLQFSWAERNFGISHAVFVKTYEKIGFALGTGGASLLTFTFCTGELLFASSPSVLATLKIAVLTALPTVLMPLLLFQIDPRKAGIQYITATITSVFLGTAVLASWLGLILYPLFRYYALKITEDRFYRA